MIALTVVTVTGGSYFAFGSGVASPLDSEDAEDGALEAVLDEAPGEAELLDFEHAVSKRNPQIQNE